MTGTLYYGDAFDIDYSGGEWTIWRICDADGNREQIILTQDAMDELRDYFAESYAEACGDPRHVVSTERVIALAEDLARDRSLTLGEAANILADTILRDIEAGERSHEDRGGEPSAPTTDGESASTAHATTEPADPGSDSGGRRLPEQPYPLSPLASRKVEP